MKMLISFQGRHYNCLFPLILSYLFFQMVSDVTAGKIISVGHWPVSASLFYFPLTFVLSDVLTEVYGYACARRVLWIVMLCSVSAGVIYKGVAVLPSPSFFDGEEAYTRVFGIMPRILLAGWIAVFTGETANNYVLAKLKVLTRGRWLWMRTIGSTIIGQGVNTILFYGIGLSGVIPLSSLIKAIGLGWLFKTAIEAACTPWVYWLVGRLKQIEKEDSFDQQTDFNPFLW